LGGDGRVRFGQLSGLGGHPADLLLSGSVGGPGGGLGSSSRRVLGGFTRLGQRPLDHLSSRPSPGRAARQHLPGGFGGGLRSVAERIGQLAVGAAGELFRGFGHVLLAGCSFQRRVRPTPCQVLGSRAGGALSRRDVRHVPSQFGRIGRRRSTRCSLLLSLSQQDGVPCLLQSPQHLGGILRRVGQRLLDGPLDLGDLLRLPVGDIDQLFSRFRHALAQCGGRSLQLAGGLARSLRRLSRVGLGCFAGRLPRIFQQPGRTGQGLGGLAQGVGNVRVQSRALLRRSSR
jgi:hypothetical protein